MNNVTAGVDDVVPTFFVDNYPELCDVINGRPQSFFCLLIFTEQRRSLNLLRLQIIQKIYIFRYSKVIFFSQDFLLS